MIDGRNLIENTQFRPMISVVSAKKTEKFQFPPDNICSNQKINVPLQRLTPKTVAIATKFEIDAYYGYTKK